MSGQRKFTAKIRKTIGKYRMIAPGDTIVVAVSGGPDSVCLLHVLHGLSEEMGLHLVAAHFDHGWRPGEDQVETDLVRSFARSLGVPFESAGGDSKTKESAHSEDAAREARYAFLEEVRLKYEAHKIALGHHLNDQAETLLMRLLRGSGPSGLAAIPPCRGERIIRPLIEVTRSEIEAYMKAQGLSSSMDSSNMNPGYLRNRIRLELVPLLLQYQPRLIEHLGEAASILREESEFLDSLAADWIANEAASHENGSITVPLPPLLALPVVLRKRIIRSILIMVKGDIRRIGRSHIRAIDGLTGSIRPQACLSLPERLTVRRTYDSLHFILREKARPGSFQYRLNSPGVVFIHEIGRSLGLSLHEKESWNPSPSPWVAHLDAEKIRFPLQVRNYRPGDRFVPLGMKGHKKIKDFFVDLKVPSALRRSTPILYQGEILLWVAGYRIDERFKVTSSTRTLLEARLT